MQSLLQQVLLLLALAALPASLGAWRVWERGQWGVFDDEKVALAEVMQWQREAKKVLWVDARPAADFASGHAPGAVRLTEDEWEALLPGMLMEWAPGVRMVVYCSSRKCRASEEVARRLRGEVGVEPVFVLRGGWEVLAPKMGALEKSGNPASEVHP